MSEARELHQNVFVNHFVKMYMHIWPEKLFVSSARFLKVMSFLTKSVCYKLVGKMWLFTRQRGPKN